MAQRGDAQGAQASARRALELDGQAPEAHNLLGYAAALAGDFEGALDSYRRALTLDENYFEVLLNAAEILIHPLADYSAAHSMCKRALELAEDEDERIDALLLMFDALLGEGRTVEARQLCSQFPTGGVSNANQAFLIGRAFFEIGEALRAAPLLEASLKANDANAEAHYYMGLLQDEVGQRESATRSFLTARFLDLEAPRPAWALTAEAFEHLAQRSLLGLPAELQAIVRPGEVYVADVPGVEVVVDGVDPRALLMLDDIENVDGAPRARVFVYQRNVERLAGALEALQDELQGAFERELSALLEESDEGPVPVPPPTNKHALN